MTKLIKSGAYAQDGFAPVTDDTPLPEGAVLVSLARFQKDRETLLARNTPIGIRLQSSENPELLGADVNHFSLIALEFPKFRDGRAFSWARILRTRLGYETPAFHGFKVLVEGENVTALSDRYNSSTNGKTAYPLVTDPETTELNRAQVSWTGTQGEAVIVYE